MLGRPEDFKPAARLAAAKELLRLGWETVPTVGRNRKARRSEAAANGLLVDSRKAASNGAKANGPQARRQRRQDQWPPSRRPTVPRPMAAKLPPTGAKANGRQTSANGAKANGRQASANGRKAPGQRPRQGAAQEESPRRPYGQPEYTAAPAGQQPKRTPTPTTTPPACPPARPAPHNRTAVRKSPGPDPPTHPLSPVTGAGAHLPRRFHGRRP